LPPDWAQSVAFVGPSPWEIWINTRGREPQGSVAPGAAYNQLCDQISAALLEWRNPSSGARVVRAVHRREVVYHGRLLERAPDLTIEWEPAAAPPAASLAGNISRFDADHQPEGLLLAVGPQIRAGQRISGARLEDLAPTILHLLDVAPPAELDGQVLAALLDQSAALG
jgi:predicted AlkP superfamily phosphohydrolase/phosphomutase